MPNPGSLHSCSAHAGPQGAQDKLAMLVEISTYAREVIEAGADDAGQLVDIILEQYRWALQRHRSMGLVCVPIDPDVYSITLCTYICEVHAVYEVTRFDDTLGFYTVCPAAQSPALPPHRALLGSFLCCSVSQQHVCWEMDA